MDTNVFTLYKSEVDSYQRDRVFCKIYFPSIIATSKRKKQIIKAVILEISILRYSFSVTKIDPQNGPIAIPVIMVKFANVNKKPLLRVVWQV